MTSYFLPDAAGNPVPTDAMTWFRWFQDSDARQIALTNLPDGGWVSTVFLGLDHGYGDGPPVLWETLLFAASGSSVDETQRRYTSRKEALAGHAEIVEELSR